MASLTKHRCGKLKSAKSKKQTTNQTTTSANTYGWQTPPDTADTTALRSFQFEHDPRIPFAFARSRANTANSYNNPMGGFSTPQLRDAQLRASNESSAQDESQALREENFGLQGLKYGQLADLASRSAPRLTQTGGTSTGSGTTVLQQPFDWNSVIQGGAGVGQALLM